MQNYLQMNQREPMDFYARTSKVPICPTCETEQALTSTGICSQCEVLMRFGQKLSPQYWTYSPEIVLEFRLAARLLDLGFYGLLWMALMPKETLTYLTFLQIVPFVLLCIVCETCLLATFGATIGKLCFGIQIQNRNGSLLRFGQSLGRTLKVWLSFLSLWFNFHVFTTYLRMNRFNPNRAEIRDAVVESEIDCLEQFNVFSWDRDGFFVISQEALSVPRIVIGLSLIVACFIIVGRYNFGASQPLVQILFGRFLPRTHHY